jgi:hypothetical protein
VTSHQIAGHLEWDPATLTRYLNGTWRIPANRMVALEHLLSAKRSDLVDIHRLPRRLLVPAARVQPDLISRLMRRLWWFGISTALARGLAELLEGEKSVSSLPKGSDTIAPGGTLAARPTIFLGRRPLPRY